MSSSPPLPLTVSNAKSSYNCVATLLLHMNAQLYAVELIKQRKVHYEGTHTIIILGC